MMMMVDINRGRWSENKRADRGMTVRTSNSQGSAGTELLMMMMDGNKWL